ncbi:hypothetical protein P4276_22910, partial [Bacillus thuringiensis]|nr:hypothetical protein [Bacillus thuringiensis]
SYTLSSQAVSTSDDWAAYFVMEKSTERMSTPDIRITLRRDVKEGNIKIENYISEFDKLKKQIDALQQAIDKMDVVKQSGGMMTGYLTMRPTPGSNIGVGFNSEDKLLDVGLVGVSDGQFYLKDWKNNKVMLDKSPTGVFNVYADNLLKKTGDVVTGTFRFNSIAQMLMTQPDSATGASARGLHYADKDTDGSGNRGGIGRFKGANNGEEYLYMGFGTNPWDSQSGLIVRPDGSATLKGKKIATADNDTGWITLPTTGVENVADRNMKYKRSSEQISVIGSVRNPTNTTVFATLPTGFRPVQNIAFPALAYGNGPTVCEVTVKSDGGIFVNGVQSGNTIHIAMNFLI